MKKLFLILCIFFSVESFSQHIPDFIKKDSLTVWFTEYSPVIEITAPVRSNGIKQTLFTRLLKNKCIPIYTNAKDRISENKYCCGNLIQTETFSDSFNPYRNHLSSLSENNRQEMLNKEIACHCDKNVQTKLDVYKLNQVLFYQGNKIHIRNMLVYPLCLNKITKENNKNLFTWTSCFSALYNQGGQKILSSSKKQLTDLGSKETMYMLTNYSASDTSKKFPLAAFLFEDIKNGLITAVDENNDIIPGDHILEYGNPVQEVINIDDNGNQTRSSYIRHVVEYDSISQFSINQHFYFDTSRLLLHSEINFLDVYRKVITESGKSLGQLFYFRIYFMKPSLYKKAIIM